VQVEVSEGSCHFLEALIDFVTEDLETIS